MATTLKQNGASVSHTVPASVHVPGKLGESIHVHPAVKLSGHCWALVRPTARWTRGRRGLLLLWLRRSAEPLTHTHIPAAASADFCES